MICNVTPSSARKRLSPRAANLKSRLLKHVRFFDSRAAIDATRAPGVDGAAAVRTVADLRAHTAIGDAIAQINLPHRHACFPPNFGLLRHP